MSWTHSVTRCRSSRANTSGEYHEGSRNSMMCRTPRGRICRKCSSLSTVEFPARRELVEDGAEMAAERAGAAEEPIDRLFGVLQLLHVRQEAAGLHGEEESARRPRGPGGERRFVGQAIEAVVDLDGVEDRGVVVEPALLRQVIRVEVAAPVLVLPSGATDPHRVQTRPSGSAVASGKPGQYGVWTCHLRNCRADDDVWRRRVLPPTPSTIDRNSYGRT